MIIKTRLMTLNDCYKAGKKITPKGIVIHSTATPGVMAAQWFSRWNKPGVKACVHAFADDREVWQYLPWNHRGWHAGGKANDTHIGIEICEPGGFKYGSGSAMIGYDVKKNEAYFRAAWKNAVELCVMLCDKYGIKESDIIDHSEAHRKGLASNHGDVMHWFPKHGENMNTFRAAVKKSRENNMEEGNMTQTEFNKMFQVALDDYNKRTSGMPVSDWARRYWNEMCQAKVFDGTMPRAPFTREQAAAVITRLKK